MRTKFGRAISRRCCVGIAYVYVAVHIVHVPEYDIVVVVCAVRTVNKSRVCTNNKPERGRDREARKRLERPTLRG